MSFKDNFSTSEDNWLPTTKGTSGRNESYPILFAPLSITSMQLTDSLQTDGWGLGNLSGSQDVILRSDLTATDRDLLGGGSIIEKTDPDGNSMIGYSNSATVDSYGKYVAASAAAGPVGQAASVTNPLDALGGTTHNLFSTQSSTNIMLFICAYVPEGASAADVQKVGMDIGGFNYTVVSGDTTPAAIGINLGSVNDQMGVIDTDTFGGAREDNFAVYPNILTTQVGKMATVMGVNAPAGTSIGVRSLEGAVTKASIVVDDTITATWNAWDGANISINLGQDCPAGFGVYFMGVKNYAAAITEHEVNRVARCMSLTGKLPGWW